MNNPADKSSLLRSIEHATHFLPTQGPITVFVHHNTLHAFEAEPFEKAVVSGGQLFDCNPFLSEEKYLAEVARGRIRYADLEAVLLDDLGDNADQLVAGFGTRFALRSAMLQFPIHRPSSAELNWLMAESDALDRFRVEVDPAIRLKMIDQTRRWYQNEATAEERHKAAEFLRNLPFAVADNWQENRSVAQTLRLLWAICLQRVQSLGPTETSDTRSVRHSDLLLAGTGESADRLVHDVLIRFCASFLDQGFSTWRMPEHDKGFFRAFATLYSQPGLAQPTWMRGLSGELKGLLERKTLALESIQDSLKQFGIADNETDEFICRSFLALRGWSGMTWQMEFNAPWAPRPAPPGTFEDFLAIRLILDRYAVAYVGLNAFGTTDLSVIRARSQSKLEESVTGPTAQQRAFVVFQLAQMRGWSPTELMHLTQKHWTKLIEEVEAFSSIERRRIFHLAYERKYRTETLDAVVAHTKRHWKKQSLPSTRPSAFQVVCCIDEREESFRRAMEELDPECETFGVAGFFGVAMYYRGVSEAHFRPLCPVVITPRHFVQEEPSYSLAEHSQRQAAQRRTIGMATHHVHVGTRSLAAGSLAGIFGSLAAFPLVARILFPRITARIRGWFGSIVHPTGTSLRLERIDAQPSSENGGLGYSIPEMAGIVEGGLRAIGLTRDFARVVVICGHGSSSLNNPHEAAHDCGACGGGRGGPNARAFAQMANDTRVRRLLAERDLVLDENVVFVGGYHNTCDDSMTWYDLDRIPATHRKLFERTRDTIYEARQRNAHERARRFESAGFPRTSEAALVHMEGRAEDLSQTRPEYGHATNALCFVGRRRWSRGLFLDRRAFLTSYDPTQDDARSSILERLLQAVIPVCAGINLEYYFSFVDPVGYGCGTKLPHNITSLLGVMDGPLSDLRTGLPWQMVEIHEPVRLLFVIETTSEAMERIINDNPPIQQLVRGGWVQLAVLNPESATIQLFLHGKFEPYTAKADTFPEFENSKDWYDGKREHLGFATINRAFANRYSLEKIHAR